jgi:hypothetical protein
LLFSLRRERVFEILTKIVSLVSFDRAGRRLV